MMIKTSISDVLVFHVLHIACDSRRTEAPASFSPAFLNFSSLLPLINSAL